MTARFDVVCLGRAAVDLYGLQRGTRLEDAQLFAKYLGGSSGNVAVGLARLGLRVAMLSVHTCPLAVLGGKDTGGMNVYVRELSRELGRMGVAADVFTRSQNPAIPRVVTLGDGVRVVHLPAGPEAPLPRAEDGQVS